MANPPSRENLIVIAVVEKEVRESCLHYRWFDQQIIDTDTGLLQVNNDVQAGTLACSFRRLLLRIG